MGFDKNTLIGFGLLAVLFMAYFFYMSSNQKTYMEEKQRQEDSLAALKPVIDSVAWRADSLRMAHQNDSISAGSFVSAGNTPESLITLENELMIARFSNIGGWLKNVELKKYNSEISQRVILGGHGDVFSYALNTEPGQSTESSKLLYTPSPVTRNADGSQSISFKVSGANGSELTHTFTVRPNDYRIEAEINAQQANLLFSGGRMNIRWNTQTRVQQKDLSYEKTQMRVVYSNKGEYDYENAMSEVDESLKGSTEWIGVKQQFFSSVIESENKLENVTVKLVPTSDTATVVLANTTVTAGVPVSGTTAAVPLRLFYGPNEYDLLSGYNNGMNNIVDLGSGIYAFVKWINRAFVLPVFNFLSKLVGGPGGWAILLLTVLIRLLIAPLTYSSYLSGAKMKALRPEIEALKAKFGGDQQAMSMEQMKLYREAGVNPLGGCVPALLQIPIFFALYAFFNSNIALRGVPFLWADDLSSFDSIFNLSFTIPFYGAHISLFTILAAITSMMISVYAMSTTPDTGNPMLKYMPYIFPFFMLFIFNKMPSALTWYYTVSNILTLILQFIIQNYIIDHQKILAKISANKAKPKSKSKWQERIEQMQETQKKMEDMKKKTAKK